MVMLPVSEMFLSLEGEGKFVGRPTVFLRTWGCNFTCSGFSNPDKSVIEFIKGDQVKRHTKGCDTAYSWNKAYSADIQRLLPYEVAEALVKLADQTSKPCLLSLTGGEPMLHQNILAEVLEKIFLENSNNSYTAFYGVLIETNTSIAIKEALENVLADMQANGFSVTFSCSPKLSNSGEAQSVAINADVLDSYFATDAEVYLKFVSNGSDSSIAEIKSVVCHYQDNCDNVANPPKIYLMPEAATPEQLDKVGPLVAEQAIKHGFFYSTRLHINLWDNKAGT